MKNVLRRVSVVLFKVLLWILRRTGWKATVLLKDLIEFIERDHQFFVTYHVRPMRAAAIADWGEQLPFEGKLAVVLQGPILAQNEFTVETVQLYRRSFKDAMVIVSTWEGEDPDALGRIEGCGAKLVLNKKPEYAGFRNINMQIVSSGEGMKAAHSLGATHAIKTRTDQRMYACDIGTFLRNISKLFPVHPGWPKQKERVIGASLNTPKHRMYGLSDMFTYGHIDDMVLYWNPRFDERVFDEAEHKLPATQRQIACRCICEVYLATKFLAAIGREIQWTLADSWQVFADHFCVVDEGQLDLFWPKYSRCEYYRNYSGTSVTSQEMSFRDWLIIYKCLSQFKIDESVLDR